MRDPGKDEPHAKPAEAKDVRPEARARDRETATAADAATAVEEPPRTLEEANEHIVRLRAEAAAKEAEAHASRDAFLRERAELENFKRRMQRERAEALRYANEPLLRELLAVIDNLERAVRAARDAEQTSREGTARGGGAFGVLVTGVEMVLSQFADILGRFGVSRVEAERRSFDPAHHEALAHIESEEHPAGTVLIEHLSGYRLHDRLLRPAQVTVAKAPPKGTAGSGPTGDGSGSGSGNCA